MDLENIIDKICCPDTEVEIDKIADDNEALPEFLNQNDISQEERDNLRLLSRSIKLQKIIDRIRTKQPNWSEKVSAFRGVTS